MKRSLPGVLSACLLAVAATAAHAAPTFDFENLPIGTETPLTLTSHGLSATFTGAPDVDPGAFGIGTNFPTPTGFLFRLMSGDFLTVGSAFGAPGSPLTITFDAAVTSISFAFALDDTSNTTDLTATTNTGASFSALGALAAGFSYPEGLATFSSLTPFSSITFASTAIDFSLDDLVVTTARGAVPEPATTWLAVGGIAAFAVSRRRSLTSRRSR